MKKVLKAKYVAPLPPRLSQLMFGQSLNVIFEMLAIYFLNKACHLIKDWKMLLLFIMKFFESC